MSTKKSINTPVITMPTLDELLADHKKYVTYDDSYEPNWTGVLLAWIIDQLEKPEDLKNITRVQICSLGEKVVHGSCISQNLVGYEYSKFNLQDFMILKSTKYQFIKGWNLIVRFETADGGFYFNDTVNHQLTYHEPVLKEEDVVYGSAIKLSIR